MAVAKRGAFLLYGLGLAAGAIALAHLALPRLSAGLPRAWDGLRPWLAPPYLFLTVHIIILLIWKLSDDRHSSGDRESPVPDASPAPESAAAAGRDFTRSPEPPAPGNKESAEEPARVLVDEDAQSSGAAKRVEAQSSSAGVVVESVGDDSIDATWKAIMQRSTSRRGGGMPAPAPAPARVEWAGPPDELNRRFDDFIKKSRDRFMGRTASTMDHHL